VELNLLFLPLLGGYIFYTHSNITAYAALRASSEHLIFGAASWGLALLIIARIVVLGSPYIAAASGEWVALGMYAVPGATLLCVISALASLFSARREDRARLLLSAETGVVILGIGGLLLIATTVVSSSPASFVALLLPAVATLAFSAIAATVLWTFTKHSLPDTMFRVSAFTLIGAFGLAAFAGELATINEWWRRFSPYPESGTAFLACVLGALLWYPLNLLFPYRAAVARLHSSGRSEALDQFLFNAAENQTLVQLSLTDQKFYIGNIQALPANPNATGAYVRLLPMVSGYRDATHHKLVFTTFYQDVYEKLVEESVLDEETFNSFIKILPISSIASANEFDPDIYRRFRESLPDDDAGHKT